MIDLKNLSGKALTDYLIEYPNAVTENILKTLDKEAWTRLLIKAPQWGKFSPWQKFNGGCWVRLLKQQPQFAKFCNWGKLNSANWGELLRTQIQFADLCPWQSLTPCDFACILQKHPQFANRCPEKLLDLPILAWIYLLQKQPSFINQAPVNQFDCVNWEELLFYQPELEKYCPWEQITLPNQWRWKQILDKNPHWAEKVNFRMDDELLQYFLSEHPEYIDHVASEKLSAKTKKELFLRHGYFEENCHLGTFSGIDWSRLLSNRPQYASKCQWQKLDGKDWEILLLKQVQFHIYCAWNKLNAPHWLTLLEKHPELLLKYDGTRFFASQNHEVWNKATIWNEEENGLDHLYKLWFDFTEKYIPLPQKIFYGIGECDAATYLIYRNLDKEQARRFFRRELKNDNWQFVEEIYDLAPEVLERLIGKRELPFLLTLAGSDSLLKKYLNAHEASLCRDINGNTLLHAALLRAVYADIASLFKTDNPYRSRYDFLLKSGCRSDVKNEAGFSCDDLSKILKESVDLFSEVINSEYYNISGATHCNNQNQMYI